MNSTLPNLRLHCSSMLNILAFRTSHVRYFLVFDVSNAKAHLILMLYWSLSLLEPKTFGLTSVMDYINFLPLSHLTKTPASFVNPI